MINLVSYNVFDRPSSGVPSGRKILAGNEGQLARIMEIAPAMRAMGVWPDVLCVQEMFCPGLVCPQTFHFSLLEARLRSELGLKYNTKVMKSLLRPMNSGLVIFSKWPIVKKKKFVFSLPGTPEGLIAKGCLWAKIQTPTRFIHVINCHLHSQLGNSSSTLRESQCRQISEFVAKLRIPTTEALFLAGDFNDEKCQPRNFSQFPFFPSPTKSFDRRFNELVGKDGGAYNCFQQYDNNLRRENKGSACPCCLTPANIDRIFIWNNSVRLRKTPRVRVIVLKSRRPLKLPWSGGSFTPRYQQSSQLSDHFPVMAQIDLG